MKTEKMMEYLKKADRTLLEMHTGMVFTGLICQIIGACIVQNQLRYAQSLWFGILFAVINSIQMGRTLDRALADSTNTQKIIVWGYVFRYVFLVCIMVIIAVTDVMNPLIVFMGYMSLKVTAYLQPLTHKLYNKLFHETDPEPQALPEEDVCCGEEPDRQEGEMISR